MDYEKKYNEALERAKRWADGTLQPERTTPKEVCELIFPELAESEDERIIEEIKFAVMQMPTERQDTKERCITWLEKQKINTEGDFGRGYDCGYEACLNSHGEEWFEKQKKQKVDIDKLSRDLYQSGYNDGYQHGKEDAQKEQKQIQSYEEKEYVRVLKSLISDFIRDNYKTTDISFYQRIYDWIDGRHIEQKPAEWSEEDERKLQRCIEIVECWEGDYDIAYTPYSNFLKSLRPQSHKEIYQATKHDLAIKFMNYLDENRPEGKMSLSNAECEDIDKAFKENDWNKIFRYIEKYGRRN